MWLILNNKSEIILYYVCKHWSQWKKMLEMNNRMVKQSEIWDTYDLVVFKVILGSVGHLVVFPKIQF